MSQEDHERIQTQMAEYLANGGEIEHAPIYIRDPNVKRLSRTPVQLPKFADAQVDQMVDLYNNGLSLREIGDRFGAVNATVLTYLRKRGVKMRTPEETRRLISKRSFNQRRV